jgi:hypothetical protein
MMIREFKLLIWLHKWENINHLQLASLFACLVHDPHFENAEWLDNDNVLFFFQPKQIHLYVSVNMH